jgi:hypothetical protein
MDIAGAHLHDEPDRYFRRQPGTEGVWARLIAPAASVLLLATAIVLAVVHFGTVLGTHPGNPASWLLPAALGAAMGAGLGWGVFLRARRPAVFATIGLGAHAVEAAVSGGMLA